MNHYQVIKKRLLTEKTKDQYCLLIDVNATKWDVKSALYHLYGVEINHVNVIYAREKFRSGRRGPTKRRWIYKKALVRLKEGSKSFPDLMKVVV